VRLLTSHSAPFRTGVLALVGLFALALTLAVTASAPSPSSAAEPPPAQGGYAVVGLYVGGDRASATQIGPLGGVTFGFFTSRPTSYDDATGVITGATPAHSCTSTADGWCNLQVAIGNGAGQVSAGTRYWVAPTAVPPGWYGNPYWQTAPLTASAQALRYQTQHVFQTPALQSGGRYLSTTASSGFLQDPGNTVTDTAFMNANGGSSGSGATSNNFMRRTASGGTWPLSRANPALPAQCGLNVALVVDLSSSVQSPTNHLPALKSAMNTFVGALQGTPSQVSITTFGTGSPANGFPNSNTGLLPVASSADAARVKSLYAGWTTIPTNYTNWDAGLQRVATLDADQHIDLAVVITDGNPTVYGTTGSVPTNSGFTRFREMENSVASANAVKALNTRVIAVGVGDGLDAGSARNLRSISGPTRYEAGGDIDASDYLQESDYGAAGDALRSLVVGACAPSISVVKQVIPHGGSLADAYTPASSWEFSAEASATTPEAHVNTPSPQQTDVHTGGTNFDVTVPSDGSPGTFDLTETPQPDYTLQPVNSTGTAADPGGQNAFCVDKTHDDAPVPVINTGPAGFSVDLVNDSAVSCTVYNQAPDFTQARVVVHKKWAVTTGGRTATYDQYDQPGGLDSSLQLGGPEPAGLSPQSWNDERAGYRGGDEVTPGAPPGESVDVAEDVTLTPPGCTLTGATMTGTGITGSRNLGTTDPRTTVGPISDGLNEWTITNAVTCRSELTLVKEVRPSGAVSPNAWRLRAIGSGTALVGPSGTSGITADVTPDSSYQLAESHEDDPELLNFAQIDRRPRPIQWEQSTGSADCEQIDANGNGAYGNQQGNDGSVEVGLGEHLTCIFTNTAVPLTVIKKVVGGTASPSDFQLHVDPVPPFPEGLPSRTFPGADSPGQRMLVRPGQTYRITETGGPADYQLTSLSCGVRSARVAPDEFTMPADGSPVVCTITNTFAAWTVEKVSDPASGTTVHPGQVITYMLTARVLHGTSVDDVIVVDDLSHVLPYSTLVEGSVSASAGAVDLHDDTWRWQIPTLSGTATLTYQVRVKAGTDGAILHNVLTKHTTTEPGDPGDESMPCDQITHQPGCDQTVNTVASEPAGGGGGREHGSSDHGGLLPGTGGPQLWLLIGGALVIAVGGTFVAAARSRRRV